MIPVFSGVEGGRLLSPRLSSSFHLVRARRSRAADLRHEIQTDSRVPFAQRGKCTHPRKHEMLVGACLSKTDFVIRLFCFAADLLS